MESSQIKPIELEAQPAATLQPWIPPTFERVPLNEATGGGSTIYADGLGYRS